MIKRTLPDGNSFSYTYEGGALKTITDMEGRIYTLKFNNRQELQQLVFPMAFTDHGSMMSVEDLSSNGRQGQRDFLQL